MCNFTPSLLLSLEEARHNAQTLAALIQRQIDAIAENQAVTPQEPAPLPAEECDELGCQ